MVLSWPEGAGPLPAGVLQTSKHGRACDLSFQPRTLARLLRPRDRHDEPRVQGALPQGGSPGHAPHLLLPPWLSAAPPPPPGYGSDGGASVWAAVLLGPGEGVSPGGRRAELHPPPADGAVQGLPAEEPRGPHHLPLLLRAPGEPGEAPAWCKSGSRGLSSLAWCCPPSVPWRPHPSPPGDVSRG